MLLLETPLSRIEDLLEANRPFAIVSAYRPDYGDQENLERTKRLAAARDAGYGFNLIEGHLVGSLSDQWLVIVIAHANRASHLLGHCRKWTKEFEQDFFVFEARVA